LDSPSQFRTTLRELRAEFQPAGTIENFLCQRVALGVIRCHRAGQLEGEFLDASARAPDGFEGILAGIGGTGSQPTVGAESIRGLADGFQRYEAGHLAMVLRCVRELREVQRERRANEKRQVGVASFGKADDRGE
jgi:hypothetical protein